MRTKDLLPLGLCVLGLWSIGTGAAGQSRQPTSNDPGCQMIALLDASASGGFQAFILGDPSIDPTPGRTWRRYPAKVAVPVFARAEVHHMEYRSATGAIDRAYEYRASLVAREQDQAQIRFREAVDHISRCLQQTGQTSETRWESEAASAVFSLGLTPPMHGWGVVMSVIYPRHGRGAPAR